MLFMYICFVMLYCIALPARVLFAIKIITIQILYILAEKKKKNTTLSEQLQNLIEKSQKCIQLLSQVNQT